MTNEIIRSNRLELLKNEVFDALDVTDATRNEYRVRITHFIRYAETHGINRNSYLDYKRYLANIDTFSVSTKNKYLIAAKIFLDGLHRLNLIPQKITDHVRGFTQSRLHRKEGLQDADIGKLQRYCSDLPPTPQNCRSLFVSRTSADRGRPVECRGYWPAKQNRIYPRQRLGW